jgi:hypothetical protein
MWKTLSLNPNYRISSDGRLYNVNTHKELKGHLDKNGYKCFTTRCDGKNVTYKAHRLVAIEFIPNPDSLPQVNHKDGNKLNNTVENLEWVTHQQNMEHWRLRQDFATQVNTPIAKRESKLNKGKQPVLQYTLNGEFIEEFSSYMDAERKTGIRSGNISLAARGKRHTAGGYIWRDKEIL